MKDHLLTVAWMARAGLFGVAIAAGSLTGGCWSPCPEPELFESGVYEIGGLISGPADQWLVATIIGAQLTVDRDASEATIRYTRDGTTYEVHYTLE
jgi:hypothetical protein